MTLALSVWLGAVAISTGCYTMSREPPRDTESRRALRTLKRYLRAPARFDIEQIPLSAPGWRLFKLLDLDTFHQDRSYLVVRVNGPVVTGDPLVQLSLIYRSLEVVRPAPLASPEDLSWIAVALLGEGDSLIDQSTYQRIEPMFARDQLAPPRLVSRDDTTLLVFWATEDRGRAMHRYELHISADYTITNSMTMPLLLEREQ